MLGVAAGGVGSVDRFRDIRKSKADGVWSDGGPGGLGISSCTLGLVAQTEEALGHPDGVAGPLMLLPGAEIRELLEAGLLQHWPRLLMCSFRKLTWVARLASSSKSPSIMDATRVAKSMGLQGSSSVVGTVRVAL